MLVDILVRLGENTQKVTTAEIKRRTWGWDSQALRKELSGKGIGRRHMDLVFYIGNSDTNIHCLVDTLRGDGIVQWMPGH